MIEKKEMPTWIYIQREDHDEFDDLAEMTWSADRINDSDVRYVFDNSQD